MNIWGDSKTQVFEQNKLLESSYRTVHIYTSELDLLYCGTNIHYIKWRLFFGYIKKGYGITCNLPTLCVSTKQILFVYLVN